MRTILILFLSACSLSPVCGQSPPTSQKTGYADTEYIFGQMPEAKQIEAELKAHNDQLQSQLEAKSRELQTKYDTYTKMPATTPDAIKADKERELQQLQEGLQRFQEDAQTSLQKKQVALMEPVISKIGNAIEGVAKEHGYTFIINAQLGGSDILLYSDEKYDVSSLVLKKLGITPAQPKASK